MITTTLRRWGTELHALKRLAGQPGFYALTLLIIGALTYLYALPSLGYYWDDWEVVFLLNAEDPELFSGYFAFDRPFAWPYRMMYPIFALNPAAWHLVTFLFRWAGVLLLVYTLIELWPGQRSYLKWLGALMLVYPGFLQQSISGAYNRHFTAFFIFSLSIYLMARAVRSQRSAWLLAAGSWLAAFVHVFTIEYFVGLELIRPFLLWLLITRDGGATRTGSVRRVMLFSLPYLIILAFYAWWRLAVFPSTIPVSNYAGDFKLLQDFEGSAVTGILAVLTRAVLDLIYATLRVWFAVIGDAGEWTLQGKISWFAFGLAAILTALFAFFHADAGAGTRQKLPRSMLWIGLWAFLVGALPIWLTSKQLSAQGRWDDRFALAPMVGACILVTWLIAAFIRPRWQRLVLGSLLFVSITTQVLVVNRYRLDWGVQNAYYWQLAWRVPRLSRGTAIISFEQPSASIPGYDASFAMNLLFRGEPAGGELPYWFFTNDRFLNFELKPEKAISYKDRNLVFKGNTSKAIAVIHQGEDRCLQVLDGVYAGQPFYGVNQEKLVAISNPASVVLAADAPLPDADIFGAEPAHTWCYYFEKADLARQTEDWDAVLELEQLARVGGFVPGFGPELLPFIEAHAHRGTWAEALEISREARALIGEMEPLLCSTWMRLGHLPGADAVAVEAALTEFNCAAP
jgi:hypothetical protein